ncbi:hypothetical protein shim_02960 [Shimia sp. SK013]|nr:hypothetical protein shim_02960 [Shimia sp. SK013]
MRDYLAYDPLRGLTCLGGIVGNGNLLCGRGNGSLFGEDDGCILLLSVRADQSIRIWQETHVTREDLAFLVQTFKAALHRSRSPSHSDLHQPPPALQRTFLLNAAI